MKPDLKYLYVMDDVIGEIPMLPGINGATASMIAEVFETTNSNVNGAYYRGKRDGLTYKVKKLSGDDFVKAGYEKIGKTIYRRDGFEVNFSQTILVYTKEDIFTIAHKMATNKLAKELRTAIRSEEWKENNPDYCHECTNPAMVDVPNEPETYSVDTSKSILNVKYDDEKPTVSGRDLHMALEVQTRYNDWFRRMCEYGFTEGVDFTCYSNLSSEKQHGGQNKIDHQITIPMAKELCMLQRTEKGKKFRAYFIKVEEAWNSPEAVMARALQFADKQLATVKGQVKALQERNDALNTQNDILVHGLTTYTPRRTFHILAKAYGIKEYPHYGISWQVKKGYLDFYKLILNRLSIDVKARKRRSDKKKLLVDYIRENEWRDVIRVVAAFCYKKNLDVAGIIGDSNVEEYLKEREGA